MSCACKLLMDCILLFSCLFLFFISSLIYLLTSTYFSASFFLFIIFILLQNIPSLLFYVNVLNTMSVDLAYLLHVIGGRGGRERQEGGDGLKKKKKKWIIISHFLFVPQLLHSEELWIQSPNIHIHWPLFSYGQTFRHGWSWTAHEPH